ncbi:MAG: RsmB/NOP family class I SAM-dependent RNA methyltransferase [Verrucomicrobiota bacterium]
MRSLKFKEPDSKSSSWDTSVYLTASYLTGNAKADQLLNQLRKDFTGQKRATAQSLFYGALRHGHKIDSALKELCSKPPQPELKAIFLVTGYELLSAPDERGPQIIHHAVERSKRLTGKAQTGFINAILRKLPSSLKSIPQEQLAHYYSHPEWLVDRWKSDFSIETTKKLLEWNQQEPTSYLKIYQESADPRIKELFSPTQWEHFYTLAPEANWQRDLKPLLDTGQIYVKDPSTRIAPDLLAPRPGELVLDLCAAPGGKAFDLAASMERTGILVAVDLPGNRIKPLAENLSKLTSEKFRTALIEKDVLHLSRVDFEKIDLPTQYDAIMLDAPCSNTGVIQRRTDVKWRLRRSDFDHCAQLQLQLLSTATKFLKPGGRLVYSTCSIETLENANVIENFLASPNGQNFELAQKVISYPWETGHDGAGAFLIVAR